MPGRPHPGESSRETARGGGGAGVGTAHVAPCDLSDPDDIDRMAHEVIDSIGVPDIVVNNAGRSIRRSVRKSSRALPRLPAHHASSTTSERSS